jgi:hypothetical protein
MKNLVGTPELSVLLREAKCTLFYSRVLRVL